MKSAVCTLFAFVLLLATADAEGTSNSDTHVDSSWSEAANVPSRADLFLVLQEIRAKEAGTPLQSYAFRKKFVFPNQVLNDPDRNNAPRTLGFYHFGIDINYGTSPKLDFSSLHDQGVEFVYARATVGQRKFDKEFAGFWRGLKEIKSGANGPVYRGAYHFLMPGPSGQVQAENFIAYVKYTGGDSGILPDDLPPAVDLEWTTSDPTKDKWKGHDPDEIVDTALSFLKRVDAQWHRSAIVYTNAGWWSERTQGFPGKTGVINRIQKAGFRLWISDYRPHDLGEEKPKTPAGMSWTLWQFSASAQLDHGYPGSICHNTRECLDASVFEGTPDQFRSAFGLTH
ncbi:MAG: GH25 family lysozyme [Pseudomonadota bacterium]